MLALSVNWKSIRCILFEYGMIATTFSVGLGSHSILIWILCFLFITTRQHALFMIFHDAVHGHLHPNHRTNDRIAYALLSVPLLLPLHRFRALHLSHHADLATERDPEEVLLYAKNFWNFKPLPFHKLSLQILGDLFFVNNLISLAKAFLEEIRGKSKIRHFKVKVYWEYFLFAAIFVIGLVAGFLFFKSLFWTFLILWILPLLTTTHLLHKFRSFAEHCRRGSEVTMSWQPGWFGKLVLWPYNIHYHREHHENPLTAWHDLPQLAKAKAHTPGRDFIHHIWSGKF